ncbi:MAG: apolipoprotein N-acyltransferase [Endomicrobium sp.]|nr:apolipoprotein N-acyltransferase [Endomicrobium sp.]
MALKKIDNNFVVNVLLCAVCAAASAAAFPKADFFFLIWISFTPLLRVIMKSGIKESFFYAFFTGFLFNAFGLYWLVVMINFNTGSYFQAAAASCALWFYLALYWGIWGFLCAIAKKYLFSSWIFALFAASLWVLLEYARTYVLTGFPWLLVGYSQYKFSEIIQTAEFAGVYAISFIIILCNSLFYSWISDKHGNKYMYAALLLTAVLCVFGAYRLDKFRFYGDKEFSAVIIQPNVDQYKKWDAAYRSEILSVLEECAQRAATFKPDLTVWPETVLPDFLPFGYGSYRAAKNISKAAGGLNLMGAPYSDGTGRMFNAAFAFDPQGLGYFALHKKNHLVPFGEYVPFRKRLGAVFGVLNEIGDFSKGSDSRIFKYGDIYAGAAVCSENFNADISRRFCLAGAKVLTNHTNDAWFFDTAAPYQHFTMNVFRAVETRKAVIVSANSGVSGIVEASGKIAFATPVSEKAVAQGVFLQNDFTTFYVKYGDVFVKICALAVLFILAVILII